MVFGDIETIENSIDVLHIADIASKPDYGAITECADSVDVDEAGKRTVRCFDEESWLVLEFRQTNGMDDMCA